MAFKVNHLHLKTPDPEKTASFYAAYTGATITSERTGSDYGLEHIAIDTDNFPAEVAKIKAAGIKILEERTLADGRKVCFFQGPEGVRLEFLETR